ncbi:MAG TPA: hypothetical protein VFJ20_02980, partial [Gemmatimonadaceae bacterium]|nr:hypothetical protein [Gemmatimonadaceae bacterium]
YSAPPVIGQGVTWILLPGGPPARPQYSIPLDNAQRAAIAGGIATAELTGQMWVVEPRVAGVFPLEIGSRVAHNGTRIAIEQLSHSSGDVALQLRIASIPRDQFAMNVAMSIGAFAGREFALLNESRHEAISLAQRGSSGGGSPMVLPGTNVEDSELSLEASPYPGAVERSVDNDWFRSARLVQIDWVPRGSYPFQTSVQLP